MNSMKGRNFWHNGLTLLRLSITCWKYHPFIEVIKYEAEHFTSVLVFQQTGSVSLVLLGYGTSLNMPSMKFSRIFVTE